MASETDQGEESVYTADGGTSEEESRPVKTVTHGKQLSVKELLRRTQGKRGKRPANVSPPDAKSQPAKRRTMEPPGEIATAEVLEKIQSMIDVATGKLISTFNVKFEALERRMGILEGENFIKDQEIEQLKKTVSSQHEKLTRLEQQLDSVDANSRLACLVLTCEDFIQKERDENIENIVVEGLNKRVPNLNLTSNDLSVAHRLKSDDKIIARFVRRQVRDRVFESRFDLMPKSPHHLRGSTGPAGSTQAAPLFINECLSPKNNELYQELRRARHRDNGAVVSSVFTKRGVVICRKEKGGANIRITDEDDLRRVLEGRRFPPPAQRPRPQWRSERRAWRGDDGRTADQGRRPHQPSHGRQEPATTEQTTPSPEASSQHAT